MIGYILFGLVALVAIVSAIGMLLSSNAIHAALFLVVNFACIALLYLGLNAPFLAMVQVTVYAGAIMVLFVFVIMLLGAERLSFQSKLRWQAPLAIVLIVVLIAATVLLFSNIQPTAGLAPLQPVNEAAQDVEAFGSPHTVGKVLFERYLLPFELTGILLLAAMIGAVVLAKDEKKRPEATGPRPEI
jgi:NADH-quinone oxidoreductase subunit J